MPASPNCLFEPCEKHVWLCKTHNQVTFGLVGVLEPLYCKTKWSEVKQEFLSGKETQASSEAQP